MDIKGSLNCRFDKQIKAHVYTLFGAVRYSQNLPLPLGEVAERSEDGEGAACELARPYQSSCISIYKQTPRRKWIVVFAGDGDTELLEKCGNISVER